MLKVIKSNVLFALVLLSIPAFACQTTAPVAQTAVKTGFFAKVAAGTGSLLSKARQAMPSLKPVNAKSCGRTAAAYLGSAAKGLLAFAKNHSKALAFTAGSLAIGALGWVAYTLSKYRVAPIEVEEVIDEASDSEASDDEASDSEASDEDASDSEAPDEDASGFQDPSAYEINGHDVNTYQYSGRLSDEPEF